MQPGQLGNNNGQQVPYFLFQTPATQPGQVSNPNSSSSGGSGITSIAGQTGPSITLGSSDSSVTITPSGNNIDFKSSGGGGGISMTSITFNSSATGTSFQPYSGASVSNYYTSTATISGGSSFYIHVSCKVKVSNTAYGYYGVGIGKTGDTRMLFCGIQGQAANGPAVLYDTPFSSAGTVFPGYQTISFAVGSSQLFTTNSYSKFDLCVTVGSSSNLLAGAQVNGFNCGIGSTNDLDLTGGSLTFYAVGSASTDIIA